MSETIARAGFKAIAAYVQLAEVPPVEVAPGITLQLISGEQCMFSIVTIQPGATVPLHSHPNEQCGTVLEGEMVFSLGSSSPEDSRIMKAGDFYVAPGGTPHGASNVSDKPMVALDIFSPPRADYLALFREKYGREAPGLV